VYPATDRALPSLSPVSPQASLIGGFSAILTAVTTSA
jgi:hypothetical protein